jgi:hypothetical protein
MPLRATEVEKQPKVKKLFPNGDRRLEDSEPVPVGKQPVTPAAVVASRAT